MASSSNQESNDPPRRLLVTDPNPIREELLKALASIVDNPLRPDVTMKHIKASVAIQEQKLNKDTPPPKTYAEWEAEKKELRQLLDELDFTLEVLSTLKRSVNNIIKELSKNKKE